MKLTYKDKCDQSAVYLDGRLVGRIMLLAYDKGWFYAPKGAAGKGETMPTRTAVKRSLESA